MNGRAELIERAELLAAAGEREGAAWALYRAASVDGDDAQAPRLLDQALTLLDELPCDRLRGSIAALAAELAFDAGDVEAGAAASRDAELRFQRAGDGRGFVAVWAARALRALRTGDPFAGVTMTRWMLPWLDRLGEPTPRIWLRLYAAEHLLAYDAIEAAVAYALDVLELAAAGTSEHLLAAEVLTRALVVVDRRDEAIQVALTALETSGGDDGVRARVYRTVALVLSQSDPSLAKACLAAADRLASAVAAPPPTRALVSPLLA